MQQLVILLIQLLPFQGRQTAQLHIQNSLRLHFGQVKLLRQVVARGLHILAAANGLNNGVNRVQGLEQPLHDMRPVPRPPQLVLRPPPDDLLPVGDEVADQVLQRQLLRLPVHQRQHYGVESGTQRRPLVQIIENHRGLGIPVQLNDHPDAPPVRLIPDFRNAHQRFVPHQRRDFFHQRGLVHLVGQFADDNALPVLPRFLNLRHRLHNHPPPPGGVHIANAGNPPDARRRRKIRAGHQRHQIVHIAVGPVNHMTDGVANLPQVVGRHIRSHPHRNARRTVHQQVRHPRGQHLRLFQRVVKIVGEINRLLVNVRQHLIGNARQPRLRVAHRRRRVAVNAPEVALPVNQRRAHGKQLRHTHQGIVHRPVPVRMKLAQHLPHNPRALAVLAAGTDAHIVHRIQNAPLHGLEAIAHIGQGAGHNHRHRIGKIRLAHLVLNGPDGVVASGLRRRRGWRRRCGSHGRFSWPRARWNGRAGINGADRTGSGSSVSWRGVIVASSGWSALTG